MAKPKPAPGGWKASLAAVLKADNGAKAAGGSAASHATRDKRADVLYAGFRLLRERGYRLESVQSFRGRHMEVLAKAWEEKGLSPSTIQNNISTFRVFAGWIGKEGMVERSDRYVSAGAASRSSVNTEDKSWEARGVDVGAKIAEVSAKDARVGLQIALQAAFGLRAREAMQLRPHVAYVPYSGPEGHVGGYLLVNVGTKGGRDRVVPVDTPEKAALIERAKAFAASRLASTSDPALTLAQAKNRYYHVLRSCGISRAEGFTGHGLRHAYASDRYKALSGADSPVRGGQPPGRDGDRAARLEVAEELGHSRESVTTHYLGR